MTSDASAVAVREWLFEKLEGDGGSAYARSAEGRFLVWRVGETDPDDTLPAETPTSPFFGVMDRWRCAGAGETGNDGVAFGNGWVNIPVPEYARLDYDRTLRVVADYAEKHPLDKPAARSTAWLEALREAAAEKAAAKKAAAKKAAAEKAAQEKAESVTGTSEPAAAETAESAKPPAPAPSTSIIGDASTLDAPALKAPTRSLTSAEADDVEGWLEHIEGHLGFAREALVNDDAERVHQQAVEIEGWAQAVKEVTAGSAAAPSPPPPPDLRLERSLAELRCMFQGDPRVEEFAEALAAVLQRAIASEPATPPYVPTYVPVEFGVGLVIEPAFKVVVPQMWIEELTQDSEIFRTNVGGAYMRGVDQDDDLGWLCWEHEGDYAPNGEEPDLLEAIRAWRTGEPLPKNWHRLDLAAAVRAFNYGVRFWGVKWQDTDHDDAVGYDYLIQWALGLLNREENGVRYG